MLAGDQKRNVINNRAIQHGLQIGWKRLETSTWYA